MAVVLLCAAFGFASPTKSSSAAVPAAFDPIPSTAIGQNSVYGRVVTDGRGNFHAVDREQDVSGQFATYRRSTDGGLTWTVGGRFNGDDGGATRPWIAVDGDRVAITYIGGWCWAPGQCEEVPYLTTSVDAGVNWTQPLRLDTQTFDVRVAVDDDRTWVAWQHNSTVELRGTADGGRTMFASQSYRGVRPSLAAADQVMVLAFDRTDVGGVATVTASGRAVGALSPLPQGYFTTAYNLDSAVAAADGRASVLLVDRPADPETNPPSLFVATSLGGGPFGPPALVVPNGAGNPVIAATHGTVAVAGIDPTGTTLLATSSNGGRTFSTPVAVLSPADRGSLMLGIATPPPDRPVARFGWSVPDRYVDTDGDGLPNPVNGSGSDAGDQLRVFANKTMVVSLDGCNSTATPGRRIVDYTWTVDGKALPAGAQPCTASINVDDGVTTTVRLTVDDDQGVRSSIEQDVTPHDHLIVSIGDSVASGEGSPLTGGTSAVTWQDAACHRSPFAGPALAAKQLEDADPHSSVTFVQLACSGAAIVDSPEVAGKDDPDTGGLLDGYHGVAPVPGSLRPSQLSQMTALAGSRPVDALLLSVGANDVKFSDVVRSCLLTVFTSCDKTATRTLLEARMVELPGRYNRLAAAIQGLGIPAGRVHLTEYFDPTTDDQGVTEMRCAVDSSGPGLLEDDEAIWAHDGVIGALNAAGRAAAASAGWQYVGGIAERFVGHGYCATNHFVVQVGESFINQADKFGSFHPNKAGQRIYGAALFTDLRDSLLLPAPSTAPGAARGRGALGEMMVISTGITHVTSVAVNTTGGAPVPGAAHRIDQTVGENTFFPGGPPAVDGTVAVGMWTQLEAQRGGWQLQTMAAQLAVRPNAAVRKVSIVQAPADGTLLVAGRDTLVQATIDAMIPAPETLSVTTTVIAQDANGATRDVVPPTAEKIRFVNGRNVVLLPAASPFTVNPGDTVSAIVEVADPVGAAVGDDVDNVGTLDLPDGPTATESRSLRVLVGRAGLGGATVACQSVKSVADRMAAYADVAIPIDAQGVRAQLFCGLQPALTQDEPGLLTGLATLDEAARYVGADAVVVVVPDGWLQAAAGGAVGVAVAGMRGVIVEASAPSQTLAHELAHIFGFGHTKGLVPASGARVDTRLNRAGIDWMAESAQPKTWTGGVTWDRLATTIGGPSNTPQPIDPLGTGVWVRGTVERQPDGSWGVTSGQWLPAGPGVATDPVANGALDLTRMSVDQLDGNGNVVASQPVGLGPAHGLYAANATPPPNPFGFGFSTRITLAAGVTSVRLVLDGKVVRTQPISAAPTVALNRPVAGSVVVRGDPLTVSWTASDPTGDALTANVFISDDDGATWRPFAAGVVGTTITAPVPQDVSGNKVRVRVVVSDGLRVAAAVSGPFSAEPATTLGQERVAFMRDNLPNGTNNSQGTYSPRLFTMRPDGTDVVAVGLPSQYTWTNGTVNAATYRDPSWGPDGRLWFVSDLQTPQLDGITDPFLQNPFTERLWSSKPDGSDLQRVGSAPGDTTYWGTNLASPSCPKLSPDSNRLAWSDAGHVWVATRTPTGWSAPTSVLTSGAQPLLTLHPSFPAKTIVPRLLPNANFPESGCPHWSPDSASLVLAGWELNFAASGAAWDYAPIVQVAADGSSIKVISAMPTYIQGTGAYTSVFNQTTFLTSADWSDGTLVVTEGFENLATFDPAGSIGGSPKTFGAFVMNPADGSLARVTPPPDVAWPARPMMFKVAPDGTLYDSLTHPPSGGSCQLGESDLAVVDRASGTTALVPAAGGSCGDKDHFFDWAVVAVSTGGAPGLPLVVADPAKAPDDGNAPVVADVATVTRPNPSPAPGADATAPTAPPVAASVRITVSADGPTTLTLSTIDGRPAPFEIVQPPPRSQMTVSAAGVGVALTTGFDGVVTLTPSPGFRGATSFTFSVLDHPGQAATATVTVIGNAPPVATDDRIAVAVGTDTVIDPSVLLANDVDPDAAPTAAGGRGQVTATASLQLVSIFGSGNGRAWLDRSGMVHVLADHSGDYTFSYLVADSVGATAGAIVRVSAAVAPADPTTTTTVAIVPIPPANPAPPPANPPPPPLGGTLPQTGGGIGMLWWAAIIFGVGVACTAFARFARLRRDRRRA